MYKRATHCGPVLVLVSGVLIVCALLLAACRQTIEPPVSLTPLLPAEENRPAAVNTIPFTILVDDFVPQPYQGDSVYYYNRVNGDRGAMGSSLATWGRGMVTTTIATGAWGGVWLSLSHPGRENRSINFSALCPAPVLPAYQSRVTGLTVQVARSTPGRMFRLELKDGGERRWAGTTTLNGGSQTLSYDLPSLADISQLVWVLDQAAPGDFVVVSRVALSATTPITDVAQAAFVWSYCMLLDNWNSDTGLVRDKAQDASGEFDAVQATGSLAGATAIAEQLDIITHADALQIVNQISHTLLLDLPRLHGLWPHWVTVSPSGMTIVQDTEWSSVDTVIAALSLLTAQSGLGMDTAGTEQMLRAIDWQALVMPGGISHGYTYAGDLLPYAWDVFGGESWLIELAYAGATGQVAPVTFSAPPTANGAGFIDELAWLWVPPPARPDYWGTDWAAYRMTAANSQKLYYSTYYSQSCFAQLGLFGLSAAEVPNPAQVSKEHIYQAFGLGGRFAPPNDGSTLLGAPVVVPHYAALSASLRPQAAIQLWDWLITHGYFTPLSNVESLMWPDPGCDDSTVMWNQLKGSWNLALQTIGWGRYLAERKGQVPLLWQATTVNPLLRRGYRLLVPDRVSQASTPTPVQSSTAAPWAVSVECEYPAEATVGQLVGRSNAQNSKVHGQFGAIAVAPWSAQAGYVKYTDLQIPSIDQVYLRLRYSKYSPSVVPILIYVDDELALRATLYLVDQGDWNRFSWTEPILLGRIASGVHSIKFFTSGQQYGVADLDGFILTDALPMAGPP